MAVIHRKPCFVQPMPPYLILEGLDFIHSLLRGSYFLKGADFYLIFAGVFHYIANWIYLLPHGRRQRLPHDERLDRGGAVRAVPSSILAPRHCDIGRNNEPTLIWILYIGGMWLWIR